MYHLQLVNSKKKQLVGEHAVTGLKMEFNQQSFTMKNADLHYKRQFFNTI